MRTRLALLAVSVAIWGSTTLSGSEAVVMVPAGIYSVSDVVTKSGSATGWIRYKAETPGAVKIRGGADISTTSYVILDGFVFDSKLDLRYPTQSRGLAIGSSNVRIENSEVVGPADLHTGYDIANNVNCDEATNFPGNNGALWITGADVVLANVLVHGFYGAGTFGPNSKVTVWNSVFRNNFNGLTITGDAQILDSVLWVHPNHLNSITNPTGGTVYLMNNVIVDGQEMIAAGVPGWDGADNLVVQHNTFYIPANKPCYDFDGFQVARIRRNLTIRDNLIVNGNRYWMDVASDTTTFQSDYNLFFHHNATATNELRYGPEASVRPNLRFPDWQNLTGQDKHSLYQRAPRFTSAPVYGDFAANRWGFRIPRTASEARAWFTLLADSPGKGAASDGKDIGMNASTVLFAAPGRILPPQNVRVLR